MKVTSTGYDPLLGQKVAQESTGYVVGFGGSSQRKSAEQVEAEWVAQHGRSPDAQELHDAAMSSSVDAVRSAEIVDEKADGAYRMAKFKHQNEQFREMRKD